MNIINPLAANISNLITPNPAVSPDTERRVGGVGGSDVSFANILSDALGTAAHLDHADRTSGLELLLNQSDDLSAVLIDAQKAELSLNLALQIRNRIIDSYNEVMRMQV